MSASKSKDSDYFAPIVFLSLQDHKNTLVILHGRGSTAERFAEPLLQHPVSILATPTASCTASKTIAPRSFREHLPQTKFVFPTAPLRRAAAFNRSLTHQWFDSWSLTEPELKQHLQIQGLRETTEYLHELLREEIESVGPDNVLLMGLSQGCAASIVATMLWQEKPFGAVVGMCGYLPFRKCMLDQIQESQSEDIDGNAEFVEGGDEDVFERSSEEHEMKSRLELAIDWLREELQVNAARTGDSNNPSTRAIPVFMGHGIEDDKVPIERGRMAAELLRLVDVDVEWKQYEGLGHWYSEAMLRDVVHFLQNLKGWEGCASPGST